MMPTTHYVIITGGNRGIGYATAAKLAGQGFHVVLAARDRSRSEESAWAIRRQIPNANIEAMELDLASLASVRAFAANYQATGYPLHVLINNAAATGLDNQIRFTPDGFELQFGVNHLGHFLLTKLLTPILKASAPARVITLSSIRHMTRRYPKSGAQFDFDNLKGEKFYDRSLFYDNTKLANIWFTYELQRRLQGSGVNAIAACPGFVPETIGASPSRQGWKRWFYQRVLRLIPGARSLEAAASDIARLASDAALASQGGKFFANGVETCSSPESYDQQLARRLWALSCQWTGLDEEAYDSESSEQHPQEPATTSAQLGR
jgi:NAD(P)-dependent dehydrogenase (short-subunit alcohol dehydrogenase family)